MKSASLSSAWLALAALLCFAPCAFGQNTVIIKTTGVGSNVTNYSPSAFLTFAVGHENNQRPVKFGGDKGGGNGSGGGANSGYPVPEGGTALMYLSLAGLCCLGAVVFRIQRSIEHS